MIDRQCPSCGGFCKKSGCERENVKSPAPDCRTCLHYRVLHASCHYQPCTNADNYDPLPPVRLWRAKT